MQISENHLDIIEAIYLVLIDDISSYEFKAELARYIYNTNFYWFCYLEWLVMRWQLVYAKHKFDLPKRNKKISLYNNIMDNPRIKIPNSVRTQAKYAFKLKELGFNGATATGWRRAKQLANDDSISIEDLQTMRSWFARHLYTSYPGYISWIKAGKPLDDTQWHNTRSIIAWLTWAGDAGFKWINSDTNLRLLNKHYPNKNYKKLEL